MALPDNFDTARLFQIRRGQRTPLTENEKFLISYIDKMVDHMRETNLRDTTCPTTGRPCTLGCFDIKGDCKRQQDNTARWIAEGP